MTIAVTSCENIDQGTENNLSATTIVLEFTNVSHLKIGDKVICKGLEIGKVVNMDLSQDGQSVFVSTEIENKHFIPKNYLSSIDLLGTKGIDVTYSTSVENYKNGDTVVGFQQEIDSAYFESMIEITEGIIKSTDNLIKSGKLNKDSLIKKVLDSFEMK